MSLISVGSLGVKHNDESQVVIDCFHYIYSVIHESDAKVKTFITQKYNSNMRLYFSNIFCVAGIPEKQIEETTERYINELLIVQGNNLIKQKPSTDELLIAKWPRQNSNDQTK
ncbi:hypothetical protein BDF19DRAFT_416827 [Syncephalis fuscata]|nr:hypothetical protein BDF19DRAFT_416827 [Syncephalis fuscata]